MGALTEEQAGKLTGVLIIFQEAKRELVKAGETGADVSEELNKIDALSCVCGDVFFKLGYLPF